MASNQITIEIKLDFKQMEKLFAEYVAQLPNGGEEMMISYRENAQEEINKLMAWIKNRTTSMVKE